MTARTLETTATAANEYAYAIGRRTPHGKFLVRRIVWGRLTAREERREDEQIKRCCILITGK